MGKNKLARWNELGTFSNVIQPRTEDVTASDHPVKGSWRAQIFKNPNPIVLELGCGKGEYTVNLAARFPGKNYIGVDIKGARMWRGARTSNDMKLGNVAFLRTRIEFINSFFSEDEVDEIWITFPDPHPGLRHAHRRLSSPPYLNSYSRFMKDKGLVHLKTDNQELYDYTRKMVISNDLQIESDTDDLYSGALTDEILCIKTHYEKLFLEKGMKIKYLSFHLNNKKVITDAVSRKGNK